MSSLAKLQADFQAYLLDDIKGAAFKSQIIDDKKVGAKRRLSIYVDAYRLRIIEALATAYPKLHLMLGDALFDSTARTYIDAYPSTYRNMRWVGGYMCVHLQSTLPQHPVAAELATFEWTLGLAFDSEDAPVLSLQDLANIPPENWADLSFAFHPSVHLLPLQWNVVQIWNALDQEQAPSSIVNTDEPCLIWRQGFNSGFDLGFDLKQGLNAHFRSLDFAEYAALQLAISGVSFGALCEQLQENASEEEATIQAAQYLSGWLNDGLIAKAI